MKYISVVTPFFHGERYLDGLLNMISDAAYTARDFAHVQWVIVNDDVEDIHPDITSELIDIKVINTHKNCGTQIARITGVEQCDGEYVLMLDQDDRIFKDWFSSQMSQIGDADAVVCDSLADGRSFYGDDLRPSMDEAITLDFNLSHTCGFIPGQVLMKKSAISEAWKRNHFSVNHCDDYYLWLCMLLENKKFRKNPDVLYEHITTGNNLSLNRVIWYSSMEELIGFLKKDGMLSSEQEKKLNENFSNEIAECLRDRDRTVSKNILLDGLLRTYEEEIIISDRLSKEGINEAVIYGRAGCGIHLARKLMSEGFRVSGFIDRATFIDREIPVYKADEIPESVTCIINTIVRDEEMISSYLFEKYKDIRVIHLRDLLA